MGVSFKISKAGKRVCPKPITINNNIKSISISKNNNLVSSSIPKLQVNVASTETEELEVSFTLNLFPDGYSITKPSECQPSFQAMLQNPPKFLHPYDRTSEALFSAIESGRLPGDFLDDIPCKYVDGTVVCEVRDYRHCSSEAGLTVYPHDVSPITNKVCLRMSLENVVKDIPMISDNTWTYGDLIEFESRILKTLQPQLCLDPTPKLDRLCENPARKKLNLDIRSMRKRRREIPEVIVTSNNLIRGKKVCIDRVLESSSCGAADKGPISGNLMPRNTHGNAHGMVSNNAKVQRATGFVSDGSLSSSPFVPQPSKYPLSEGAPTMMQGRGANSNALGASPSGQDMMPSYKENFVHARRDTPDGPVSPATSLNKTVRLTSLGPDSTLQHHMGAPVENLQSSDMHWNNTLLKQNQFVGRGSLYPNNGMRFPKEEPVETNKSETYQNRNDLHIVEAERIRVQQRLPPQNAFMRSNFPQPAWNNYNQPIDNNLRKEDQLLKRKLGQNHHLSNGGFPQSELASKSEEFSLGPAMNSAIDLSQKDKSAVNSVPAAGGTTSLTSSANAKRRSNSLPKTSVISGIGSPASVGNISVPFNVNSPADEMLTQVDPMLVDRFSKIELVADRYQINCRKNKVDEKLSRKPAKFPSQEIMDSLSNEFSGEHFKDESENKELAKSRIGGSMNACKIRVLTFYQNERIVQGNGFALVPKWHARMMLSANPSDGTIAMHYGDILESESLTTEEYLPTLPNTHLADLLAAQLSSLMTREGYEIEDKIYPKANRINNAQQNGSGNAGMEIQQYSDVVSGQQIRPTNSSNLSSTPNQNVLNQRMLSPQNPHALQLSQGFPQQNEPQPSSLQQQPNQLQRSAVMFQPNQLPSGQNSNAFLGSNQMVYKPSQLQIQLMQQQQQNPQRKMTMGMGGDMANNMGGLGNVMGIGGPTIPGMGQNPMNIGAASNISNTISQQIRTGQLTPQAIMALRMGNRGMMGGGAQTSFGGIPGARQMHPGSILGHSLNRVMNPNLMQRSGVGPMAPPKVVAGMNVFTNPHLQQQHQQQFQQQDMASPLHALVSLPQQLSQQSQQQQASPQQMIQRTPMSPQQMSQQTPMSPQQMIQRTPMSPQQMSQRTPMSPQHSSGAVHSLNVGNPETCLSSQTVGLVSSIANSPIEHLQDVNKNNSISNA